MRRGEEATGGVVDFGGEEEGRERGDEEEEVRGRGEEEEGRGSVVALVVAVEGGDCRGVDAGGFCVRGVDCLDGCLSLVSSLALLSSVLRGVFSVEAAVASCG